jgi:hypothetical protein
MSWVDTFNTLQTGHLDAPAVLVVSPTPGVDFSLGLRSL